MCNRSSIGLWAGIGAASVIVLAVGGARVGGMVQAPKAEPKLGILGSLEGKRVFPADNAWNRDISKEPVDSHSEAMIESIGPNKPIHPDFGSSLDGHPGSVFGIPYMIVSGKSVPKKYPGFEYSDECDLGPYPIPADAPIEGGTDAPQDADRHVLIIDSDDWKLYEIYNAHPAGSGGLKQWKAASGAIFDLSTNAQRPAGWTSADAAGLPIFPGLVRYDEVGERKEITHAIRFTCRRTRRAYVPPARHFASKSEDPSLPPMGMRVRIKASFDASSYPPSAQVIIKALKKYGMILADNGGDWFVTGTPDPRWKDNEIETLKKIKGSDFEVVKMGDAVTR